MLDGDRAAFGGDFDLGIRTAEQIVDYFDVAAAACEAEGALGKRAAGEDVVLDKNV